MFDSWEDEQAELKMELEGALQGALNNFIESVRKFMEKFKSTMQAKVLSYYHLNNTTDIYIYILII